MHKSSQKCFEIDAQNLIWEHWTTEVLLRKYDYTEASKKPYIEMYKNEPFIFMYWGSVCARNLITKCSEGLGEGKV